MQITNFRKTALSLVIASIITISLSCPAVAFAQSDAALEVANLLAQPVEEVDLSYLGWDAKYAHETLGKFMSSPLHYSRMELADITTCTLWSEGDIASKIVIDRFTTQENLDILHAKLSKRIKGISKLASNISDEEQRAWILVQLLAETTVYDKDISVSHSPYGALLYQKADCAGISTAYKLLCDAAGIDCDVVSGIVYDKDVGYSHAWNVVRINGEERYIDVTFSLTSSNHTMYATPDWFLLTKEEMELNDHYLNEDLPVD